MITNYLKLSQGEDYKCQRKEEIEEGQREEERKGEAGSYFALIVGEECQKIKL